MKANSLRSSSKKSNNSIVISVDLMTSQWHCLRSSKPMEQARKMMQQHILFTMTSSPLILLNLSSLHSWLRVRISRKQSEWVISRARNKISFGFLRMSAMIIVVDYKYINNILIKTKWWRSHWSFSQQSFSLLPSVWIHTWCYDITLVLSFAAEPVSSFREALATAEPIVPVKTLAADPVVVTPIVKKKLYFLTHMLTGWYHNETDIHLDLHRPCRDPLFLSDGTRQHGPRQGKGHNPLCQVPQSRRNQTLSTLLFVYHFYIAS